MTMIHPLVEILARHKQGAPVGVYSVCSANRYALQAAMTQARQDDSVVLIEATSNQVNQFGGYTGLTPEQFVVYLHGLAAELDFPVNRLILGGDHLGPNTWQDQSAVSAMAKAKELISSFVTAGFTKLHLDASMRLGDEQGETGRPLEPTVISERAAELCLEAEKAADQLPSGTARPLYIIGTDVPIPGGAQEAFEQAPTTVAELEQTIATSKEVFLRLGLESAWERVIGIVIQPGVEFSHDTVIDYDRRKTTHLTRAIAAHDNLVFEAHSTDYQTPAALAQMVTDHFAILKVGPELTYALREAVMALAQIEREWLRTESSVSLSGVSETVERVMLADPRHWKSHYQGAEAGTHLALIYSFSDRIRYYWPNQEISKAVQTLLANLENFPPPLTLLSQYLPTQYRAVRAGELDNRPEDLIRHKIMEVTQKYAAACEI